jgi:hydrogenase-4 component E
MAAPVVPSTYAGVAEAVAVVVLLTEFAMLRNALLRSQVRLYAVQSLAVVVLASVAGATRHLDDLYALAALSFLLKVVVVPWVVLRLVGETRSDLARSNQIGVATMVLVALALSALGLLVTASLPLTSKVLPAPALGMAAAVVLVAFALVILRRDVVSQAVGFFSMENGVSLASMVLAAGLPLIVEVAFLFDLLVAVVVFGVLMRVHHVRTRTLSTDVLDRLRG